MQHFRRLAATAVITGLLGLPMVAGAQDSGFTQRGVTVETNAENAVVARTQALATAQRQAYAKMASELGFSRSASDSQIEGMVDSIIVEQERATRTGYSGRLTVNFNPRRVASFAGISAGSAGSAQASSSGGGSASGSGSDAAPPVVPPGLAARNGLANTNMAFNPASAFIETVAQFGGMAEWLDLRRRLLGNPEIVSVDIVSIAVDGARLRLGLRSAPAVAAQALASQGVTLQQTGGVAPASAINGLAPPVRAGVATPVAAPNSPWLLGIAGRV
jgi:hypothetical protein